MSARRRIIAIRLKNKFRQISSTVAERPARAFMLVFFFSLILFYLPFLAEQQCFYYTDTTFFLKPETEYLKSGIFAGSFPIWNPFNYCGMPQIAVTFPTLFYPPDWLLIAFPFSFGLAFSMVFHQLLGSTGIYALLKNFYYPVPACCVAALIFSLSGYTFCLVNNHSLIAGTAWFVMTLAAFRYLEIDRGPSNFWKMIFSALSTAFLLYSGRPEIIAPSLTLLIIFMVWQAFQRSRESRSAIFDTVSTWQVRALFIGSCLAMPQLLPVGEWLAVSRRASGLQLAELFLYSATWYDLLSSVIGPALGDLRLHAAQFRPLVQFANLPPYISCAYLGPFAITLAVWGACDSRWKYRLIVICALVASVLVSLGNNAPILPLLIRLLPALGLVRFPIKWLFLVVFFIAILASRGMMMLIEGRATYRFSAALWIIFAAFTGALLWASENNAQVLPFIQTGLPPEVYLKAERLIALSGLTTSLIGSVISISVLFMRKLDPNDKALPIALVLLTGASLFFSAFNLERSGAPSDFWTQPSYAADHIHVLEKEDQLPENSRVLNLCLERFTVPPTYLPEDANKATQLEYQYDRQVLKPNSNIEFNIPETLGFEGTTTGDFYYTGLHSYLLSNQSTRPESASPTCLPLSRFCALTSTQYVITQKYRKIGERVEVPRLDDQFFELRHESEPVNLRVYKVKKTLPRCYLASVCKLTEYHNQVLESILREDAGAFDPSQITFIEGAQAGNNIEIPSVPIQKIDTSSAKDVPPSITVDGPEHVRIEISSKYPTTLVLTDRIYAGWVATLDDAKVPIEIANGFMRAVEIPTAGRHTVDFTYEPESLKLGLTVFWLAIFLVLCIAFADRAQKDRKDS